MNDATSGTHADDEALEVERRPAADEVDPGGGDLSDADPDFTVDPKTKELK